MYQIAHRNRTPLFTIFVDLRKAYNCVSRSDLFFALACELRIPPYLVAALRHMY